MRRALIAFLAVTFGAIGESVWWVQSHRFQNVACSNVIYQAHHIHECAVWLNANGIQMGITIPAVIIGGFGTLLIIAIMILRWVDEEW